MLARPEQCVGLRFKHALKNKNKPWLVCVCVCVLWSVRCLLASPNCILGLLNMRWGCLLASLSWQHRALKYKYKYYGLQMYKHSDNPLSRTHKWQIARGVRQAMRRGWNAQLQKRQQLLIKSNIFTGRSNKLINSYFSQRKSV